MLEDRACGRRAAGSSPSDQDRAPVDGALFHARLIVLPAQWKGPDTGPTVCQGRGSRSNEKPRSWQLGQMKEQAGFLVSRSLTLHSVPTWAGGVIRWFSRAPKKKPVLGDHLLHLVLSRALILISNKYEPLLVFQKYMSQLKIKVICQAPILNQVHCSIQHPGIKTVIELFWHFWCCLVSVEKVNLCVIQASKINMVWLQVETASHGSLHAKWKW